MPPRRPPDTTCICLRCSKKPLVLRQISRDLAKKHLKTYGPAPLHAPDENHRVPSAPGPSSGLRRPLGDISGQSVGISGRSGQPDHFDGGEDDFQDVNFGDIDEPAPVEVVQPPGNVLPSDTVYRAVKMPCGPDLVPEDDPDGPSIVPRAYRDNEPSCVRIAYLQAVYNNVCVNMPVTDTNTNLGLTLSALDAAGVLPDHPRPVRTLYSARRRLGIDPDHWIIQYAICPRCWKHHTPNEMLELASPQCSTPDCNGLIYDVKEDAKGRPKRHPVMILPQTSLIQSLRRMVRRKGFRKLVRDSRNTPMNQNDDDNFVMTDMHDGTIWHDLKTGIKREIGNYGTVRDVPIGAGTERKLTDFRFGLHLNINIDW
jgi:hypothetical protein